MKPKPAVNRFFEHVKLTREKEADEKTKMLFFPNGFVPIVCVSAQFYCVCVCVCSSWQSK